MGKLKLVNAGPRAAKGRFFSAAFFFLATIVCAHGVLADHPSYSITADLGPGNEDFEKAVLDFDGVSKFQNAVARVRGYDLSGRDLRMAELHLYDYELRDVNLDGANLTGANLEETFFDNCSFRNAILRRVLLSSSSYVRPTCDLAGADISGSWIRMTEEQLKSTKNYREKDLSRTVLVGKFHGVSFAGFNLQGARILDEPVGCDFTDADISVCRLRLSKQQLYSTKNYKQGNLDGIHFIGCDFRGVDFSGQNLGYFDKCDLTDADFTNACLARTPNYMDHMIRGPFPGPGFSHCQLSAQQFYATRTYKSGKLPPGTGFGNMDLQGWDFSGMEIYGVGFAQSSLRDANLARARGGLFEHAEGISVEQVESTYCYKQFQQYGKLQPGFSLPTEIAKVLFAKPTADGD